MGKVKDILRVALRENALYVPPDIKPQKEVTAGSLALVKELERYGFAVDEPLLHALNGARTDYFRTVVSTVKEVLGIGLNWTPLVRDWETPTGESAVDHLITLYFNVLKERKPPSPPYWDDEEERYVGAVGSSLVDTISLKIPSPFGVIQAVRFVGAQWRPRLSTTRGKAVHCAC